jgi:hypothetical protein
MSRRFRESQWFQQQPPMHFFAERIHRLAHYGVMASALIWSPFYHNISSPIKIPERFNWNQSRSNNELINYADNVESLLKYLLFFKIVFGALHI